MRRLTAVKLLISALLLALSVAVGWMVSDLFIRPILTLSLTLERAEYAPGDVVNYVVTYDRRKVCKTQIERVLYREETLRGVPAYHTYFRDELPGLLLLGYNTVISHLNLPADLPAGRYTLLVQLASYCGFVTRVDQYPTATLTVR